MVGEVAVGESTIRQTVVSKMPLGKMAVGKLTRLPYFGLFFLGSNSKRKKKKQ